MRGGPPVRRCASSSSLRRSLRPYGRSVSSSQLRIAVKHRCRGRAPALLGLQVPLRLAGGRLGAGLDGLPQAPLCAAELWSVLCVCHSYCTAGIERSAAGSFAGHWHAAPLARLCLERALRPAFLPALCACTGPAGP